MLIVRKYNDLFGARGRVSSCFALSEQMFTDNTNQASDPTPYIRFVKHEGADNSERAWRARVGGQLELLLGDKRSSE